MRHFINIAEGKTKSPSGKFYHGTPFDFTTFDPKRAADGHAQEGCGFYFTSSREDALRYASGGFLFTVDLLIDRELALKGKAKRSEVEKLMRSAPNLEDTLMNWDEDPNRAFQAALTNMMSATSPKECFEQVWWDFYRSATEEYLHNVSALGYGGTIIPKAPDSDGTPVFHVVMYNAHKIKIISREKI